MTAYDKDCALQLDARRAGVNLTTDDARTLRRAELTLHNWDEMRCGWSTPGPDGASFVLVSDHDECDCAGCRIFKGRPFLEEHPNKGFNLGFIRVPDRERGALERVKAVCARYGADYYHQGDPRGASLYIADHALDQTNYTGAVSCAVR